LVLKRSLEIASAILSFLCLPLRRPFGPPPLRRPHIVVGVTNALTCLVLRGRLRALREAGFRVTLIANPGPLLERTAISEGVEFHAVPMERSIALHKDLVSFLRLWGLLCWLRPDMTEFSTPKAGLLGTVAAKLAGVPVRVYMLRGLRLEAAQGRKRRILCAAERMAAACAQTVLCNSPSLRSEALQLGLAPADKLRLLGAGSSNGVDPLRFAPSQGNPRRILGLPSNAPVVGFVGRLTYAKGLPDLIVAFERILAAQPAAWLLLVGWFDAAEDALSRAWKARILSHPRILVTGMVDDTAPYYGAMDLLVLPTWREGFPNAVLEAAASGLPAITTWATGARDAVAPGVTGLLIPPGYPSAITAAVLQLLENPTRRQSMGQAARAWAVEHYSFAHVMGRTTDFYQTLLQQGRQCNSVPPAIHEASVLDPV
jgi:glycosyltransferase involved in cell wall biosynthesis